MNSKKTFLLFFLLFMALIKGKSFTQPAQLDPAFGQEGIVTTSLNIIGGYSSNGSDNDIVVVRYNTNGTRDNAFGNNGIVITPVGNSSEEIHSIAIQGDGKIVEAGYANLVDDDFAIIRYNSDGGLDTSLGTNGVVTTPVGDMNDYALAVAIQSEDTVERIVAAGYCMIGSSVNFALVCYKGDGSLDPAFGTNGIIITPVGTSESEAHSVAIKPGAGKIIAAGFYNDGNRDAFALACYNSTGELDNNSGTNGIVTIPVGYSEDLIYSIAIQGDGKIIAAGSAKSDTGSSSGFVLVRYNPNGSLDNTFGTRGIIISPLDSAGGGAYEVGVQNDGKIIVTGYTRNGTDNDFALASYNSDGSRDNTFGINGIVTVANENSDDLFYSLAIVKTGPDSGKIVAAGRLRDKIAVARFNINGTSDFTFGINGIVTASIGSLFAYGNSVADQDDGKILIATFLHINNTRIDFAVIRYNSNGILDNTFGVNGVAITSAGSVSESRSVVVQSARDGEGKIIAVGYSKNGDQYDLLVVRYNTDGTLDNTFGTGGIETTKIGNSLSFALAATTQPSEDGSEKLVIGGYSIGNKSFVTSLARYTLNELTALESDEELNKNPVDFFLEQNYPNPFNPATKIKYSIPAVETRHASSLHVTLKVFDILGRKVATLVNEFMQPGTYNVIFDASGFSSGVYYYRLIIGEFEETKKINISEIKQKRPKINF